ncbi:MAG: hypothetical protein V2I32_05755 [Desulforhopalus sp.]|jgi:hypothetical protein|nr:hypothetical protein [Desulforhopalus sp.]
MKEQPSGGIISRVRHLWQHFRTGWSESNPLAAEIDRVVELADPTIRRARRYRQVLRDPVAGVMNYCSSVIDAFPGPVRLSRKEYFDNPAVKALFVNPEDLESLLLSGPDAATLRQSGYTGEVVALLTMSKEEKTVLGYQQQGEIVLRDVAQRSVNFVDHRLVAPSPDLAITRAGILARGLEVLATVAMERITGLRNNAAELREKRAYLKGAITIFGGKSRLQEQFSVPDPAMAEKLRAARERLVAVEGELAEVESLLATPEDALRHLSEVLVKPAETLTVQRQSIFLNWMNVLVDSRGENGGHEIVMAELSLLEELRRYGIFVIFSLTNGELGR